LTVGSPCDAGSVDESASGTIYGSHRTDGSDVVKFNNGAEKEAWTLAEALNDKSMSCMKEAEDAAERFRVGKVQTRRQFKQRGLSEVDADIRWSGTATAKKALGDNSWYMQQAQMYSQAATAQYAKALYLRSSDDY
jgi:hypothetical protein